MSQPCLPISRRRKRNRQDEDEPQTGFDDIHSISASEYLSRVVNEAKNLPDICVAPSSDNEESSNSKHQRAIPIDGSAASLSYLVSGRASLTPPPTNKYLPNDSRVWVEKTLANFERLRVYLEKCKDQGIGGKKSERIPLPPMKERSEWHIFCVGENEASGNVGSYFDDTAGDAEEAVDEGEEEEIPEWRQGMPPNGHAPSVRLVLQIDQVLTRRVLSHLSYYVSEGWSPCTPQRSAWFYALLAKLEHPLHRDDAAILFGLLKKLTQIRATIDVADRTNLARLNVLIVIVGIYFEQGGGYARVMQQQDT
jgi:survival of motor neuron protein-interacting protein 1